MPVPDLTCREFVDFIASYLDRELSAKEAAAFDEHLSECPECRIYLDGYEKTRRLQALAFDPAGPPPDAAPDELVAAILDVRRRSG